MLNQFSDKLNWIDRLPDDIKFVNGNFRFYFSLATLSIFNTIIYLVTKAVSWLK